MSRLLLHPIPGVPWVELRDAAADCARHGWPVLPGTYQLDETDNWWGRPRTEQLEPAWPDWPARSPIADGTTAAEIWSRRPYSLLLRCGAGVAAIHLAAGIARDALPYLRLAGLAGPVVVTPFHALLLIVATEPGAAGRTGPTGGFALQDDGWVGLPPTVRGQHRYRWHTTPQAAGWRLPPATDVHAALLDLRPPPTLAAGVAGPAPAPRTGWPTARVPLAS